ncbi:MAG: hypothetical protein ACOYBY_03355 [Dermatophilaceae bacterium]
MTDIGSADLATWYGYYLETCNGHDFDAWSRFVSSQVVLPTRAAGGKRRGSGGRVAG